MFLMARRISILQNRNPLGLFYAQLPKINLKLPAGLVYQVTAITSDSGVQFAISQLPKS